MQFIYILENMTILRLFICHKYQYSFIPTQLNVENFVYMCILVTYDM